MATKKTTTKDKKEESGKDKGSLILSPHVTEKASMQSNQNAYTFVVDPKATKVLLFAEIKKAYKVTPLKINITKMARQYTFIRGKLGTTAGIKKAIVFLKKGDTIALA